MMEVTKILYDGNHDYSEQISRRCSHLLPRPKVRNGVRDQNICQGKSYSGEQWVRLPNVNAVL